VKLGLICIYFCVYFQYHKHLFVHISSNAGYTDPLLEVSNHFFVLVSPETFPNLLETLGTNNATYFAYVLILIVFDSLSVEHLSSRFSQML